MQLILIFSGERDAEKRVRFDDSVKKSEDGMNFTQNYTNEFEKVYIPLKWKCSGNCKVVHV